MRNRTKSECPALAQIVRAAMTEHQLTFRTFADRAIDEKTGYQMSHQLVHDISTGCEFKVSPRVLRALAAGAGIPLADVQQAAVKQFIGVDVPERADA